MKLTFSRQELMAALLFASQDEARYVLNGLCLKYRPGDKPIAIATDGRRLAVIETNFEQEEDPGEASPREIILSSGFLKPICALNKAIGAKLFPLVTIENKIGSKRVAVTFMGGKFFLETEDGALIEGEYPNWLGVIPPKNQKREPISEVGINAEYVGDYAKAVKILEASTPQIQMNLVGKDNQIEVKLIAVPNFYGLVMPCKLEEGTDYQPEFLGIVKDLPKPEPEPEPEPEPAAA